MKTSATAHGGAALRRALQIAIFPAECAMLLVTIASIASSHSAVAIAAGVYFVWLLIQYMALGNESDYRRFSVDSYYVLEEFYNFYFPLTLAILLASNHPAFWSVVGLTVLWRIRLVGRELRNVVKVAKRAFGLVSNRAWVEF